MKTSRLSFKNFLDLGVHFGALRLGFMYDKDEVGLGITIGYDRTRKSASACIRVGPYAISASYEF